MGIWTGRRRWIAGAVVFLASGGAWGEAIPAVRCASLAGQAVRLPEDLRGRPAVLVMGFSRESQDAVRGWGERLGLEYGASGAVAFYEMAMLEPVPRLARGLVIRSMKREVSEGAQAHFLTVTEDEATWRQVAHYREPDAAYVVLVDGGGNVVWRTAGAATDAAWGDLRGHVGR